nr:proteoglycan 4-like [Anolis sagrei ordinatus]
MDEGIPDPPLTSYDRYRASRQRMPYYRYYSKPLGPPLSPFVKKRLPKYGSQYIPFYGPRYFSSRTLPLYEKGLFSSKTLPLYQRGHYIPPYRPSGGAGYQPRGLNPHTDSHATKLPQRNLARNPTQPHVDMYQRHLLQSPYNGVIKDRRGTITKGSVPDAPRAPLPRVTKGPVLYSPKDLEPHLPKAPLPRMTKGPVLYSPRDLEPHLPKGPPPYIPKSPSKHSAKRIPPLVPTDSQLNVNKAPQHHTSKGMLSRATKGSRTIASKVPRFSLLNFSRSLRKKASRRNRVKTSQTSLVKGSQPSLTRDSRGSLAKSSQPNLVHTSTCPDLKKLSSNVKVSRTGKKYCSAAKWPF